MNKLKGLGRGLGALGLGDDDRPFNAAPVGDRLATLPIEQLQPGRYQPRTRMDEASLDELAASIRSQGLMQPILVRSVAPERFEIIAGERRWRASQRAGLAEVPVLIREVADQAALAMALVENIQREDLNALEEANGIQRLIDEFHLTHHAAADMVGRSRAAVSNLLRLRTLTAAVQELVFEGRLDMGHARALVALPAEAQTRLARLIVDRGLSVRATEQLVYKTLNPDAGAQKPAADRVDRDIARLEEELADLLGTSVEIKARANGSGKLQLSYSSLDHLDGLLTKLRA